MRLTMAVGQVDVRVRSLVGDEHGDDLGGRRREDLQREMQR